MPPIEYQRETVMGGELEWTSGGVPRRGSKYCWGSLQSGGMHHGEFILINNTESCSSNSFVVFSKKTLFIFEFL